MIKEIRPQQLDNGSSFAPHTTKILVADDNPDNIRLLSIRLEREGYQFITSVDGQDTLDKLRLQLPDLVLLDINMPIKDGFEVVREMRSDPLISHIPVIIVTAARIAANDVREGLNLGADDYVTKPLDWQELSARIRAKLRVKRVEDNLRNHNRTFGIYSEISNELVSQLNLDNMAKLVLSKTVAALNASNGFIAIFQHDGTAIQLFNVAFDFSPWTWDDIRRRFANQGILNRVFLSHKGAVVKDTLECTEWVNIPNDQTRSALISPLIGQASTFGVLVITHETPNAFIDEQLSLLQAIASQAAASLESAQLYALERQRSNELVALNHLSRQISPITRSAELFEKAPTLIIENLSYPAVAIWYLSRDEQNMSVLKLIGLAGAENAPRISLMELATQQAINKGQAVQISGSVDERTGERFGVGIPPVFSSLAVPLYVQGEITGALSIHSKRPSSFSDNDRVLLETISTQIGAALERIQLFESVEQEQKKLAAVLKTAGDAILVFSNDGRLEMINTAGRSLFTNSDIDVSSLTVNHLALTGLLSLIEKSQQSSAVVNGEITWEGRTFSVIITPVEELGQVVLLHDVSRFASINQLKDEFLATATHDLKNPIFAMLGYADLMARVGPLNEAQLDFLSRIRKSGAQMQDLVINLLEIARIELDHDIPKEIIELQSLTDEVIGEFSNLLEERNHHLVRKSHIAPIHILGNPARLAQVIRNLLSNAIKYTPSAGEIKITTDIHGGKAALIVQDSGIGIPDEAITHIFDKFYRVQTDLTQDIEGNGLGLAITKSIIEQHNGTILVQSKPGTGSIFKVYLPVVQD